MDIDYCVFDPTGNTTILVTTPVPAYLQPEIGKRLMAAEPKAEQAGFLSRDETCDISLRMAGGEFCGNASMCAAVYKVLFPGFSIGPDRQQADNSSGKTCSISDAAPAAVPVTLRVSGASAPIRAEVTQADDGSMIGTVEMPRPAKIRKIDFPDTGTLPTVFFDGIAHVILENVISRPEAEEKARSWCRFLGTDAIGLMFLDRKKGILTPLVYVPGADTLCWENSCASGTTAAAAYLASLHGSPITVRLRQPGGSLSVSVSRNGDLSLSGHVRFLGEKSIGIISSSCAEE